MTSIKKILKRPADLPTRFLESPLQQTKSKNNFFRHLRPYANRDPKIGVLQRPWRPRVDMLRPEAVFVMARQNYRVYAYLGPNHKHLTRVLSVLDTGAGSSYLRKGLLRNSLIENIKPQLSRTNVWDASNRRVRITGIVTLSLKIGTRTQKVRFNVVDH